MSGKVLLFFVCSRFCGIYSTYIFNETHCFGKVINNYSRAPTEVVFMLKTSYEEKRKPGCLKLDELLQR